MQLQNNKAVITLNRNKEIPSFVYTSAHTRDLDQIRAMAADLSTFDWKRGPGPPQGEDQWEDYAIDDDIDEFNHTVEGKEMINDIKKKMICITYHGSILCK